MSRRTPSVAPPLVSLFFFSAFVAAQTAICTDLSFHWTFNSIGQSPCIVAAYMLGTCNQGIYIPPLPPGTTYGGPTLGNSNPCECSTVGYSLTSACVTCQGEEPFSYTEYTLNCTSRMPHSQFPNPVPAGIYVPHWAILDVTAENNWNADESYNAGDTPEYGPGAIFGASGVYTSSAGTSSVSASSSSTAPPTHSHSGGHAGAIAGGTVGGIAMISITIAAILFCIRRRRSQAASADVGASMLMPNDGMAINVAQPSLGPPLTMRIYDPNDPTTFPTQVGSGSTPLDMQTSVPNNGGYRGIPMPH